MSERIVLYTTLGCHLCVEAEVLIHQAKPMHWALEKVDVAEDDELLEAYGEKIPVVEVGGKQLFWPFSLVELHGAIHGA